MFDLAILVLPGSSCCVESVRGCVASIIRAGQGDLTLSAWMCLLRGPCTDLFRRGKIDEYLAQIAVY